MGSGVYTAIVFKGNIRNDLVAVPTPMLDLSGYGNEDFEIVA